jgi:hypothetical protein
MSRSLAQQTVRDLATQAACRHGSDPTTCGAGACCAGCLHEDTGRRPGRRTA